MKRIACLWFPNWSIQRTVTAKPELSHSAILTTTELGGRGVFVWACNRLARQQGVRPGMPLCEARSFVEHLRNVHIEPFKPVADRRSLEQLALRCERYCPCVGLEDAEYPECLLLDVTGLAHLFAGELSWAKRIQQELTAKRFMVHVAIGDSIASAWAAARFLAKPKQTVVLPAGSLTGLLSAPVEGLRIPESEAKQFRRLGITSIRQVLGLNRASLASRFSPQTLLRLRQFTGEQAELVLPCQPPPVFQASYCLEHGTAQLELLCQIWDTLLRQLRQSLQARYQAARTIRCDLTTENKNIHTLEIRLCEPLSELGSLLELLKLKLENFRPTSPIVGVRLEATETCPIQWQQQELLSAQSGGDPRQLSALLNRLSSRLGPAAVVRPLLVPDPVPERAVRWLPVTSPSQPADPLAIPRLSPLDRPTGLLPNPIPLEVLTVAPPGVPSVLFLRVLREKRLTVAKRHGPERIDSGWWAGPCVRRDYYQIETTEGEHYWVFRQQEDGRWFLHGALL